MTPSEVAQIRDVLLKHKNIAVVGYSNNPSRPSHGIAHYLSRAGYRVTGVRPLDPSETPQSPIPVVSSLEEVQGPLEIVNVFRRPDAVPELVEQAIALGAKAVWLQEGAGHAGAEAKAKKAGLLVISERCIYRDHLHLFGSRKSE